MVIQRPVLICGLGNPGKKYEATRHNAGFMTIDRILEKITGAIEEKIYSDRIVYKVTFNNRQLHFLKPLTFMNHSGVAVHKMMMQLQLNASELLVVYDCLDLPLGCIRLRQKGSSGGHRGMDSIIRELETDQFPRLRIGIGRPQFGDTVDYVLSPWYPEQLNVVQQVMDATAESVLCAAVGGVESAMNRYNSWSPETGDNDQQNQGEMH